MATRTVRLDDESERVLEEIVRRSGMPVSTVLKHALLALKSNLERAPSNLPYDVYRKLDLGSVGWSIAPSTDSKRGVREALRKKHRR
jgi:hypothetical protein